MHEWGQAARFGAGGISVQPQGFRAFSERYLNEIRTLSENALKHPQLQTVYVQLEFGDDTQGEALHLFGGEDGGAGYVTHV